MRYRDQRDDSKNRAVGNGRSRHGERGQSLVEVALVVPILVLILAAVIDASRVFDATIVLTQAVREAARLGTIEPGLTVDEIAEAVTVDVNGSGTNITQMQMIAGTHETDWDVDVVIGLTEVTVSAWYRFPLWFGGLLGVPEIRVSREAVMPLYYPEDWEG